MTLEDLIYQRLTEVEELAARLARFSGAPAIAYQAAPPDTDPGWEGKPQYPRIDYTVDMQANPERNTCGILTLNIWCDEQGRPPEEIEPHVRAALQGVFIKPDGSYPYSLEWVRTDAFEQRTGSQETLVVGVTVTFDVFAFPSQETTDPDPVIAFNEFVKTWAPDALVIGKDEMGRFTSTTEARPIFYFRLASLQTYQETNTVAWMDGTIAAHIFAPEEVRLKWLKAITDALALAGEVEMMDTSPMFLRNIKADSGAPPLTTGQLRISVRFGIIRRPKYAHALSVVRKH